MSDRAVALGVVLQTRGYRLTAARQVILAALADSGGHISADDLVTIVRDQAPGIGRMTVYRTLELLCQLGLARPVYQGTGAAHFVLIEDGHHHHLVCSSCKQVIEFDECEVAEIEQMIGDRFRFVVHGHLLEFYGLCPACQGSESG